MRAPGYACITARKGSKLEKEKLHVNVTKLPVVLGRQTAHENLPRGRGIGQFIAIGSTTSLSKLHAKIYWDFNEKCFMISALSKNGVRVGNKPVHKGQTAPLDKKVSLRVGTVRLYFTIPENAKTQIKSEPEPLSANKVSYPLMVRNAFYSGSLNFNSQGTTQREIIDFIMARYEGFDDPTKKQNLTQGVYMCLSKHYEKSEEIVGEKQKRVRWRVKGVDPLVMQADLPEDDWDGKKVPAPVKGI